MPYFFCFFPVYLFTLFVLQINYEAAALACWEDSLDDKHLVFGFLHHLLQVIERTHGLVVHYLDDKALRYSGILHLATVNLQNLKAI